MEAFLSDLTGVMRAIFTSGDWVKIAIIVLVALIGSAAIGSYRQAIGMSIIAMVLLAAITIIVCVATGAMPGDLSTWSGQLENGWNNLMVMTGSTLVGYFFMFFVAIIALFTVRRMFFR